jgi:hypothetical protein
MKLIYSELVRYYERLPRHWRIIVTTLICLVAFSQALTFGESIGKALYSLTH